MPTIARETAQRRYDDLDARPYQSLTPLERQEHASLGARLRSGRFEPRPARSAVRPANRAPLAGSRSPSVSVARPLSEWELIQLRLAAARTRHRARQDDDAMAEAELRRKPRKATSKGTVGPTPYKKKPAKGKTKPTKTPDPSKSPSVGIGPQIPQKKKPGKKYPPHSPSSYSHNSAVFDGDTRKKKKNRKKRQKLGKVNVVDPTSGPQIPSKVGPMLVKVVN
jgi:hypothetical protein